MSFEYPYSRLGTGTVAKKHLSLQLMSTSPTVSPQQPSANSSTVLLVEHDEDFDAVQCLRLLCVPPGGSPHACHTSLVLPQGTTGQSGVAGEGEGEVRRGVLLSANLLGTPLGCLPYRPPPFFGMLMRVVSGAVTPIFSFLLSQLFFEVSIGNVSIVNGTIVLGVATAGGLLMGSKYFEVGTSGIL